MLLFVKKNIKFNLIIAGDGKARHHAEKIVKEYYLNDFVCFVGWTKGENKLNLFRKADILVLPSWIEGFPNSIIEAMSCKLAVVVTSVGTIPDIITNFNQAIIIPPRNIEKLIEAMKDLILDSSFRWNIANNGFNFANENFSTKTNIERLYNEIQSVM